MNNNLYQWHNERMVDLEMQEIRRELSQANLFRQAGATGGNWLARAFGSLLELFRNRSQQADRSPDQRSQPSRRYRAT